VIAVVVSALLIVMLAVPTPLPTVASALPAPVAFAVNVEVAVPFDWMLVCEPESVPLTAFPQVTGNPSSTPIWLVVSEPPDELWRKSAVSVVVWLT
jgi:hypothetical protein